MVGETLRHGLLTSAYYFMKPPWLKKRRTRWQKTALDPDVLVHAASRRPTARERMRLTPAALEIALRNSYVAS